ncbi:TPA: DUF4355 domain-containing protein [Streptococcus suis]|uniref:DUF4355 domain-containing protein n=1 Tax=Streptococcus suis TaxID=1307 RepID=UPI0015560290|nr:DUF4355 domain-containing protein [Streptococcus suis]MDY7593830.1 DUF4355 domain-containing protein [Streptococcus suis]MDY7594767.1 DUF4355 domain-containing protein [Streptococcus suis]NQQ29718.1 DUF4355 domain-containing protein [Streptococcus suis]HEL2254886.1 DUF4355 domain-containing protein [Streptococcus suis]HEL2406637.1 DUF4355 domain-containing protein [Streptococcus suis]
MNEETQTVEVVEDDKQVSAEPEQVTTDPKDEKKYTDADVDAIIDKKFAKWKAEQEKAESEAKKLSKMNAEDKQKYQLDKREQDLADREAEITRRELTAEAKTILSERGLPIELVDVVNLTDADSVRDSIDAIQKTWEAAVLKGVADKTKGSAPMKKAPQEQPTVEKWERDFLK